MLQDLVGLGPVTERLGAALVANYALLIEDESRGPVGPFRVDVHLKRHAVGCADGVGRVGEYGKRYGVGLQTHVSQHVPHAVRLMGVNGQNLHAAVFKILDPVAQLRELPVADWSGVSIDEDQDDFVLTVEISQPIGFAQNIREREIRRGLTQLRRIHSS